MQSAPVGSQMSQVCTNVVGLPAHVPASAVTVWPPTADPEIVGREMFVGAPAPALTSSVRSDSASLHPLAFVAVTETTIECS